MGVDLRAILFFALITAAGPASARPVVTQVGGVDVDWTRGLMIAKAGSAADLRAPSAEIARVKAERVARERATRELATAAASLPRVPGLGAPDPDDLAGEVVVLEVGYGSDGTAVVEVGLPIEAVRRITADPDLEPPARPGGPTALVIDASGVSLTPAVGYRVAAGDKTHAAPVLFFRDRQAVVNDERLGKRIRRVSATGVNKGVLQLGANASPLVVAARAAGAPIIVLIK